MANVMQKNRNSGSGPSSPGRCRRNLRRMLFGVIGIALLYTLVGVFLMPGLAKDFAVKAIKDTTGRDATIADVGFSAKSWNEATCKPASRND